jgi:hypothetical protein
MVPRIFFKEKEAFSDYGVDFLLAKRHGNNGSHGKKFRTIVGEGVKWDAFTDWNDSCDIHSISPMLYIGANATIL